MKAPQLSQQLFTSTQITLCVYPSFLHSSSTFLPYVKVWKQKGEEYRITGYGGWSWISKTYVQRFVPKLPGNTNANYRKELEGLGLEIMECFRFNFLAVSHLKS